jgi:hypothetical protein
VGRRVGDRLLHCRSSSFSSSAICRRRAGGNPPTGGRCRVPQTKRKAADPGFGFRGLEEDQLSG